MHYFKLIITLTFLFLGLCSSSLYAQSYYLLSDLKPYQEYEGDTIKGKRILSLGIGDRLSKTQKLPFPFMIYGKIVTHFKASDNGYITFDTTESKSFAANQSLPLNKKNGPQMAIFACWYDWEMKTDFKSSDSNYSSIKTKVYGKLGNRVFTIQWYLMTVSGKGYITNFQLSLFERDSSISIFFQPRFSTSDLITNPPRVTIGINKDGTDGNDISPKSPFANYNYYSIIKGKQPEIDIRIRGYNSLHNIEAKKILNPYIYVQNFGKTTLSSLEVSTFKEGKTNSYLADLSSNPIEANGGFGYLPVSNVIFNNPFSSQNLKVWISKPNGDTSKISNPKDDSTNIPIYVIGRYIKRKLLYEGFTSALSSESARVNNLYNDTIRKLMKNGDFCPVFHHLPTFSFIGDPMFSFAESDSYIRGDRNFVRNPPTVSLDGEVFRGNPENLFTNLNIIKTQSQNSAGAKISISSKRNLNNFDFLIQVRTNIEFQRTNVDLGYNGKYYLYASIVADEIVYKNDSSFLLNNQLFWNKEYKFPFVNRKMLPDANGTDLSNFQYDDSLDAINLKYQYDPSIETNVIPAKMRLVVWIQHSQTMEVLQTEMTSLEFSNNIEDQSKPNINATMFPNPSNGTTTIRFELLKSSQVAANVMDMQGRTVLNVQDASRMVSGQNQLSFDASTLNKGIYFVNITVDGVNTSKKLIVE